MRRTSDRVEGWATTALIVAILLFGPWAAVHTATAVYRYDIRANAYERAHRFRVQGVLMEDATWPDAAADADQPPPDSVPILVRWSGPSGAVRTGTAYASVGQRIGSTVEIWVDDRGAQSVAPGQRSPRTDAIVAVVLGACAVFAGLAGVRRILRWTLDRRRLRSWQAEWRAVGPRWSKR